ncbi:MAG: hypothetical protein KGS72_25870 [Cyanobacteria bacterium REEB67]|nr:hypothetical protein [Cyanobacteria bacterium REEB67]
MTSQNISFEVRGAGELLSHTCLWQSEADAPECTIELPRDGEIILSCTSVGKITMEGGLHLDMTRSQAGVRLFTWSPTARTEGEDGDEASITIEHPSDDFPELTINIVRAEEAALSVEAEEPVVEIDRDSLRGFFTAYGAYIVAGLAAVGALIFALLMPAHRDELIGGAAGIAIWGYLATDEGDKFRARLLLFLGAGLTMCFAMAMPGSADELIGGAGLLSMLAILCGDNF